MELISIIIPVYNVEEYLEECIDSVLDQTYDNLEILLIDDGSTDESSAICKRYAAEETNVVYLHKENGGLSDARNFGMKHMKGNYFTFIDSDDIIPKDYILKLYESIKANNARIALCDFVRMVGSEIDEGSLTLSGALSSDEVVINCFKGVLAHSACAKLLDKSVAEDLEFPYGVYFEDEYAMYDIMLKHSCCVTNETKYIYRKREGSITQNSKIDKQNADLLDALEHVEAVVNRENPELSYALDFKILQDCMVIIKKDIKLSRHSEISERAVQKIKKLNTDNLQRMNTGKSFFIQYKMIKACYPIYRFVFWMMFKLHLNTEA